MNSRVVFFLPLLVPLAVAQNQKAPEPPVPVYPAPSAPVPAHPRPENQQLYKQAASQVLLVPPEVANEVVTRFRAAYTQPDAPRIVIYVNRELVDAASGLKLKGHTERYEKTETKQQSDMTPATPATSAGTPQTQVNVAVGGGQAGPNSGATIGRGTASSSATKTTGENTYEVKDPAAPTLADRQTVREVERLFGRVFRNGGAKLADQKTAAALLGDDTGRLVGDQAAKDRDALTQIADIAIEVLISSRNLTVTRISGEQTFSVPDIQATAIRLKDSAIMGQASASDVLGKDRDAGPIVRQFDVRDITEATAIALMEDMLVK